MNRNKEIIKTGVIGIIGNSILSAIKMAIGVFTNSIAIALDGVNNISDALSSLITIVGTRLSEKEPDKKHPFGYGRIEYLTSLTIGVLILYAGLASARNSVIRILEPEPNDYSARSIIIIGITILVKILLGIYTSKKGRQLQSGALTASGHDALNDSVATAATLIAALLYIKAGISIEAYIGLGISVIILKTAFDTLRDAISLILGEKVAVEIISSIRSSIMTYPEVDSIFGIVVHNYGSKRLLGSANIEIPEVFTVTWTDNLQRSIKRKVYEDTGVEMLGITFYAENMKDPEICVMRESVRAMADETAFILGIYGFYVDKVDKVIRFNAMVDFEADDIEAVQRELRQKVSEQYPGYDPDIDMIRAL